MREGPRMLRRMHAPRWIATNVHMPDRRQAWTAWTASELSPEGRELFQSELIYDASGRLAISRTVKTAERNPAIKIIYDIGPPAPGELRLHTSTNGMLKLAPATAHDDRDVEFV